MNLINSDCWFNTLIYLDIQSILRLCQANKEFNNIVTYSYIWNILGKSLHLQPPNPKARKFKTWKDVVTKINKKKFCELCFTTQREIPEDYNKRRIQQIKFLTFDKFICFSCQNCRFDFSLYDSINYCGYREYYNIKYPDKKLDKVKKMLSKKHNFQRIVSYFLHYHPRYLL